MHIDEILSILPQRYPFVMIDRVLELEPGVRILAAKNVSTNEDYFRGHFPERPVMPGVLMLEALAQASIVLFYASKPGVQSSQSPQTLYYLVSVKVRFLAPVFPGDQLLLEVKPLKMVPDAGIVEVSARVGEIEVARGEMSFAARQG